MIASPSWKKGFKVYMRSKVEGVHGILRLLLPSIGQILILPSLVVRKVQKFPRGAKLEALTVRSD
jgi:hypothetical protein